MEIGCGRGALTRRVLPRVGRLIGVELDPRLARELSLQLEGHPFGPRFRMVRGDFLKLGPEDLFGPDGPPSGLKWLGNLPYAVASPILQKVLSWPGWSLAVFMFQREVAERILAKSGSRGYGLLALSVRLKCEPAWVCAVPRSAFWPRPEVESAVVRFAPRVVPLLPEDVPETKFFEVARAAFGQRRKTLLNSLSSILNIPKEAVRTSLEASGIPPGVRAEEVPLESFVDLARRLP